MFVCVRYKKRFTRKSVTFIRTVRSDEIERMKIKSIMLLRRKSSDAAMVKSEATRIMKKRK